MLYAVLRLAAALARRMGTAFLFGLALGDRDSARKHRCCVFATPAGDLDRVVKDAPFCFFVAFLYLLQSVSETCLLASIPIDICAPSLGLSREVSTRFIFDATNGVSTRFYFDAIR
ncbi:MAG: hypothetical protein LBC35_00005, partial [Coriobacteriales bacterium]|nr:hypothetical protein [Coriobacteriales bacterium]